MNGRKTVPSARDPMAEFERRIGFFKKRFGIRDESALLVHMNLVRLFDLVRTLAEKRMRGYGLTPQAFGILAMLEEAAGKGLTMHEIGNRIFCSQANVTGLVDTLEKKKLVHRQADPRDRRVRSIHITARGSRLLLRTGPQQSRFIQSLYAGISAGERRTLVALLAKIRQDVAKTFLTVLAGCLIGTGAQAARAASALRLYSLEDCYRLARGKSEQIRIQREKIVQTEAAIQNALGTMLPHVSLNLSDFFQDTSGADAGGGGVGSTLTSRERPETKFVLQQAVPLVREFSAVSASRTLKEREKLLLAGLEQTLYAETARDFYGVAGAQNDLANVRSVFKLTQERTAELKERVALGKSRRSELLSTESRLASLEAQEEKSKSDLTTSRQTLRDAAGLPGDFEIDAGTESRISLGPVESYLSRGGARPDLQAQQKLVRAARLALRSAVGRLFPSASVLGNYYLRRSGFQSAIDWDVLLALEIPLFQGGQRYAAVRDAASSLREAQLVLDRSLRLLENDIRNRHTALASSLARVRSLQTAFEKARESYDLQVKEYRLGQVNNLEVLDALNRLQDARKDLDAALIESRLAYVQLQVSVGSLP